MTTRCVDSWSTSSPLSMRGNVPPFPVTKRPHPPFSGPHSEPIGITGVPGPSESGRPCDQWHPEPPPHQPVPNGHQISTHRVIGSLRWWPHTDEKRSEPTRPVARRSTGEKAQRTRVGTTHRVFGGDGRLAFTLTPAPTHRGCGHTAMMRTGPLTGLKVRRGARYGPTTRGAMGFSVTVQSLTPRRTPSRSVGPEGPDLQGRETTPRTARTSPKSAKDPRQFSVPAPHWESNHQHHTPRGRT